MNNERLVGLLTTLTEMKAVELRKARELLEARQAYEATQATWKESNDGLNAAQKALDEFIRTQTIADAKEIDNEWRVD